MPTFIVGMRRPPERTGRQVKFNRSDEAGIIKIILTHFNPAINGIFAIRSFKFLLQARLSLSRLGREEGKSGQHRAMHRLTAGS